MLKLYQNYKEIILYIVFGVLTTVVNIVSFFFFDSVLHMHYLIANLIAWVLAVLFAYETNRRYVFVSNVHSVKERFREFVLFVSCRLFSGGCDMVMMYIGVDVLLMSSMLVKIAANVLVVILNYVFSKVLIFRKKEGE